MKNTANTWGLTPAELRKLRSLKTPHGIQRLLNDPQTLAHLFHTHQITIIHITTITHRHFKIKVLVA